VASRCVYAPSARVSRLTASTRHVLNGQREIGFGREPCAIEEEEIDEVAWFRSRENARELRRTEIGERLEVDAFQHRSRFDRRGRFVDRIELERPRWGLDRRPNADAH